jgi:predicted GIY-YIG superfamily endonuclease
VQVGNCGREIIAGNPLKPSFSRVNDVIRGNPRLRSGIRGALCRPLIAGWSSPVARQAHNLKVLGSNPSPATNLEAPRLRGFFTTAGKLYKVYVIQNPAGKFYIGLSEDVTKRVRDHNSGISKWTKSRGPWTLVWTSEPLTLTAARKLENLLKRQKGGAGFYQMTGLTRVSGS